MANFLILKNLRIIIIIVKRFGIYTTLEYPLEVMVLVLIPQALHWQSFWQSRGLPMVRRLTIILSFVTGSRVAKNS